MNIVGTVHKIEHKEARGEYPARDVLILNDCDGSTLDSQAEETYIEVELQGDGKNLKRGDVVKFWGRFSWGRGSTIGVQCRGKYTVNGK